MSKLSATDIEEWMRDHPKLARSILDEITVPPKKEEESASPPSPPKRKKLKPGTEDFAELARHYPAMRSRL